MGNDISFLELRNREVVNSCDGRRLGRICNIVFSAETGKIKGIVLPFSRRALFARAQDLFIPWQCVKMLGEDVILVEVKDLPPDDRRVSKLAPISCCPPANADEPKEPSFAAKNACNAPCPQPPKKNKHDCDGKCEKCMLFDCADRWQF